MQKEEGHTRRLNKKILLLFSRVKEKNIYIISQTFVTDRLTENMKPCK